MSCSLNRRKRQAPATSHLPSHGLTSWNIPFTQRLFAPFISSAPLQHPHPSLVPDPITDPVVATYVYEDTDTVLEEGRNVVFGGV